jgi:hypothetical protein
MLCGFGACNNVRASSHASHRPSRLPFWLTPATVIIACAVSLSTYPQRWTSLGSLRIVPESSSRSRWLSALNEINKDVVRHILGVHFRSQSDSGGPSWLTFLGHMEDSLWCCDLFRCESATLRTNWVLVVMDRFTRRIVGFGAVVCPSGRGFTLCCMIA